MAPVSTILHRLGFRMCRYLNDWLIQAPSRSLSGSPGSGDGRPSLSGSRCRHHLGEVQSPSIAASGLSGCYSGFHSFQGFSLPAESREAMLNRRRISVLLHSACLFVARASRSPIILDSSHSRRQAVDAFPSAPSSSPVGSERQLHLNSMGSGLSSGLGVVACSRSSPGRCLSGPSQPSPRLLVRRLGRGVGCSPLGRNRFRPLVSGGSSVVQRKGASCGGVRSTALPSFGSQLHSSSLFGQLDSLGLPSQTVGHSISGPQLHCVEDPPLGGDDRISADPPVHSGQEQCSGGLPVSPKPGPGGRVDSEVGGVSGVEQQVAGDDRPFCHLVVSPLFTLFFTLPRSVGNRYGCVSSELGWVSGLCLSTLVGDTAGSEEVPIIFWGPHDSHCSILAPEAVVSGPPGSGGGRSNQPNEVSRSPQPTALSLSSSRDRQSVPSCLETIQRFARFQGFSSRVAKQLGFARRSSSRAVYQSKWLVSGCRSFRFLTYPSQNRGLPFVAPSC